MGNVQAVYSYKEREGIPVLSGYEYDHKVAEVKIEKGRERQDIRKPDLRQVLEPQVERFGPSASGWAILRKSAPKGAELAGFTLRKMPTTAGRRMRTQDGGYNVVYVNGIQPIKK